MKVVDPFNPSVWNFYPDPAYVWDDKGKQIIYLDTFVEGESHADATTTNTGQPSAWNAIYDDLYNKVGFVKESIDSVGNRGYTNQIIINASRPLTAADKGLITIQTTNVGTPPTANVALVLPTRPSLTADGCIFLNTASSAPFLVKQGNIVTPYIINGYTTSAGAPLAVSVSNPISPGTPVPGNDMAQYILLGNTKVQSVNLFDGEYAEFVPMILHDTATDLWYLTWRVFVHNSSYQKFNLGGPTGGVNVVSGVPDLAGYSKRGNVYNFNITSSGILNFLPNNAMGGGNLLYVKFSTSTPGGIFTIKHNVASPPTGFKAILASLQADMSCSDGDIVCFIEQAGAWYVHSISGIQSNFNAINGSIFGLGISLTTETTRATTAEAANATAITNEATARATAITTEATARASQDSLLGTGISTEQARATAAENAIKAAPSWTTISAFTNSWTSFVGTARFCKNSLGIVFVQCFLQNTSSSNNATIAFNIAGAGNRPTQDIAVSCPATINGTTPGHASVTIAANGDVTIGANGWSSSAAVVAIAIDFPTW